jgi:chemotaxis signal transduction protein
MSLESELQEEVDLLHARLAELEARFRGTYRSGRKPGASVEVLFVRIGDLHAAFELDTVKEVVPAAALAPLPEAPAWVLGTLKLRGSSLPVVHIGARLNRRSPELLVQHLIVIASTELGTAGFVVDDVGIVLQVTLGEAPSLTETPHAPYVVGSFTHQDRARLVLGIQELLRHSDLAKHVGASAES